MIKSRGMEEIKLVIKNIRTKIDVKVITSDGWLTYSDATKKVYGFSNKTHNVPVSHNVVTVSKGEGFNIMIEKSHNSFRERAKTFRGFHGSVESAETIMKGYEIFYNFIREH